MPGERIFYVQLADAPQMSLDVLSWSRHFRCFPGQGDLPVDQFLRAVLASGYRGPLSLEVFNDHFRAAPARLTARDGLRSLILAEAGASGPQALPALPEVDGIAFLEFAVDEAARAELATLLGCLGFHLAGRHRSKAVELWLQGNLRFVLNSEQDSAAAEHFQHHGPSVCAMALRVDDPARALARARALLIPEWRERVGAGERAIPAVRGPDGTLIYLVGRAAGDDFWAEDFYLLPDAETGKGLGRIDHLALALQADRLDSYVLFWRALFGLAPQPVWDLPDPHGLIHSRAMVNASGMLRLTFNVSDARGTLTNRFVSAFAGAGVQHVALATDDAVAAMAALVEAEAPMLAIPGNYYEDLGRPPAARGRRAGDAGAAGTALRPGCAGRLPPRLQRRLPEPLLLRGGGAYGRLFRVRRAECRRAHGGTGAPDLRPRLKGHTPHEPRPR